MQLYLHFSIFLPVLARIKTNQSHLCAQNTVDSDLALQHGAHFQLKYDPIRCDIGHAKIAYWFSSNKLPSKSDQISIFAVYSSTHWIISILDASREEIFEILSVLLGKIWTSHGQPTVTNLWLCQESKQWVHKYYSKVPIQIFCSSPTENG